MADSGEGDSVTKFSTEVDDVAEVATSSKDSNYNNKCAMKNPSDFLVLNELGEGSFSVVFKVKELKTDKYLAMKVILKKQILKERKVEQVFREKNALARLSEEKNRSPFFIQLYCTFQDEDSLYIVTTLAENGDLLMLLKNYKNFKMCEAQFYISEIVVALGHMHRLEIIHRDIKPENILLSSSRHILVSDFGSSKLLDNALTTTSKKRRSSFVGTAEYVSPEVLNGLEIQQACDYWALGVILYQLLVGKHMFGDVSEYLVFKRILRLSYKLPENIPEEACDLIKNLVVLNAAERLGSLECGGVESVMQHAFFDNVKWENLHLQQPPLFDR